MLKLFSKLADKYSNKQEFKRYSLHRMPVAGLLCREFFILKLWKKN